MDRESCALRLRAKQIRTQLGLGQPRYSPPLCQRSLSSQSLLSSVVDPWHFLRI
jgi:hypothetical protein